MPSSSKITIPSGASVPLQAEPLRLLCCLQPQGPSGSSRWGRGSGRRLPGSYATASPGHGGCPPQAEPLGNVPVKHGESGNGEGSEQEKPPATTETQPLLIPSGVGGGGHFPTEGSCQAKASDSPSGNTPGGNLRTPAHSSRHISDRHVLTEGLEETRPRTPRPMKTEKQGMTVEVNQDARP